VDLEGVDHVFDVVLQQARAFQRSAYHAAYLELAMRRGIPFATRDEPLMRAAVELGRAIFQPES
jgi:predicted nucleic acid-binding protein